MRGMFRVNAGDDVVRIETLAEGWEACQGSQECRYTSSLSTADANRAKASTTLPDKQRLGSRELSRPPTRLFLNEGTNHVQRVECQEGVC